MNKSKLELVKTPEKTVEVDPLTELLRNGAKSLIAAAVEAELEEMLKMYSCKLSDGRESLVRNGYLPARIIQTGIGDVEIKIPKIRDRNGEGMKFNSSLLPPYLKRTKSIEELIPWLYLKGVSTGGFQEALSALLGDRAKGLSSNTISRLKADWLTEYQEWIQRDLSQKKYVYFWADGIYSNVRMDNRVCLLVIIGVTEYGTKELVAVEDGFRESTASWEELLIKLKQKGLNQGPKLATGDGAMGFWNALSKIYPECKHQRCWVHKTANVLNKIPKSTQPKVKQAMYDIWMAETKKEAEIAFNNTLECYSAKYPVNVKCGV